MAPAARTMARFIALIAPVPRIDQLLHLARPRLESGEAELLLAHVLDRSRTWLFTHGDAEADAAAAERFEALVRRREQGEPVAYLMGRRGFWRFDLEVDPATLIPRPETERLVELALARLPLDRDAAGGRPGHRQRCHRARTGLRAAACDRWSRATPVRQRSRWRAAMRGRLHLGNIEFRHGDWFAPLHGERFDLIASNPPYIALGDPHLGEGDLRFEPASALASGADGLDAIRIIVAGAPAHLEPEGWLLLEHGWDQGRGRARVAGRCRVRRSRHRA